MLNIRHFIIESVLVVYAVTVDVLPSIKMSRQTPNQEQQRTDEADEASISQ